MKIGDFNFKNNTRTFIVAELSANHNKDINVMIESIKEAKKNWSKCSKNPNLHSGHYDY